MKTKTFLFLCLIMGIGLTTLSAQTLQKGAVLGFHNGTFTPNPDVTMNQCMIFLKDKYIPEFEKNFPGMKGFLLKGIRGDCVDCISILIIFQSDNVRNKYWKAEGVYTELGNAAYEKTRPVIEEMAKFGKMVDKYTDWVIQQHLNNEMQRIASWINKLPEGEYVFRFSGIGTTLFIINNSLLRTTNSIK